MRRRNSLVLFVAALAALVAAGAATAANGGFTPPAPHSPNASRIGDAYWFVFAFCAFIFVVVEVTLVVFIVRFRHRGRGREVEGPQIRGHTRLELAWTAGPALILAIIAAFTFYELPGIKNAPAATGANRLTVRVEGHQFYWQFVYPGGQVSIDRMVVPVGKVVHLTIVSPDVAHSWWVPALGGKTDAIPGQTNHTFFVADKPGVYEGRCAEFCGIQHAEMQAEVAAVSAAQFDSFLASHAAGSRTVGNETVVGACAKCHGFQGQGLVGPAIAGNSLLNDTRGLTALLRAGRPPTRTPFGMPAVGKTWSQAQLDATIAALKRTYGKGTGGG